LLNFTPKYFTPADSIIELQKKLCHKYSIDVNNTLVVSMRGSDKNIEVQNASPDCYYEKCKEILKSNPDFRIWIQTDQKQYQDYFLERYPKKAFVIKELPITQGHKAIHNRPDLIINRFEFGKYLVAVMHLISRCNVIITHTGNIGYWHALFRGNLKNFYQDTTHFFSNPDAKSKGKFNCLPPLLSFRMMIYATLCTFFPGFGKYITKARKEAGYGGLKALWGRIIEKIVKRV